MRQAFPQNRISRLGTLDYPGPTIRLGFTASDLRRNYWCGLATGLFIGAFAASIAWLASMAWGA